MNCWVFLLMVISILIDVYPWVVPLPLHFLKNSVPFYFLEYRIRLTANTPSVTRYLDDFLFMGRSSASCLHLLLDFRSMCATLGVPLAPEKTEGPVQAI